MTEMAVQKFNVLMELTALMCQSLVLVQHVDHVQQDIQEMETDAWVNQQ